MSFDNDSNNSNNSNNFNKKDYDNIDFIDIVDSDDDMSKKSVQKGSSSKGASLNIQKPFIRASKVDELDFIDISDSEDEKNKVESRPVVIKNPIQKMVKKNILVIKPDSDDD
jgi:hypothetical protein